MKMKSSVIFPLLLVLSLAFASVVFTKAHLEFLDVEDPSRDQPEQKYKECLDRCERRHEGKSFQERCHDDCKERRRQAEERRAQEQGGSSRGREEEEQRRQEKEREREEVQRKEHEKGSGKEREEQRRQEERAREEEEKSRQEEEQREQEGASRGQHEEQQRQEEQKKARDSKKQYKACLSECGRQSQGQSSQEDCRRQCKEKRQRGGRQDINEIGREREQEEEEQKESGQGETNPYVFEDQHFSTLIETQQGRVRVLPKFTERSKLLKGIENYRVLILEAEPQTFLLPNYYDADTVFFVAQGRGTMSFVRQNKRESFNIQRGDVAVVPAGTTAYVINRSNNEKLIVAKLVRPVNTPGRFEPFFGAGGEEPKSFYRTFTKEILEAAFNTKRENIEKVFGQQRQGAIVKASEEQIRELSRHEEGGIWPFGGGESKGTINIFQQTPLKSNKYGQLYEVTGSKLHQLQDLNVAVSVANISQGSMSTLLYNSRATKIAIVVNGEGYLEMACPHLSQSQSQSQEGEQGSRQGQTEERQGSPSYQKVTAQLKRGVVVVIPAGHPHVVVASENQNLEIVGFAINANNNERFPLAGRSNVINQLEKNAKELAFGVQARKVDEVFGSQDEEFFFKGPSQRQRQGQHESRADA